MLRPGAGRPVLKIAIAHPRLGALGGGSIAMRDLVECLAADPANEVTVLARSWEGTIPATVRFERTDPPYLGALLRDAGFARAVWRRTRSGFDLVLSDQKIPGIDVYIAGGGVHREWVRRRHAAWPAWRRLWDRFRPYQRFLLAAEEATLRSPRLRAVVCVSATVRQDFVRHFRLPADLLHVVYNGIDLARFDPAYRGDHRTRLRAGMGVGDRFVLLFVGGGMANKGIVTVLQAMARCGPESVLLVVGKDRRLSSFRRLARQLGIESRCSFVGPQADVRPYYAAADAFVLPSRYETFGLVYLEALAMGVPVLVSRVAGAAEIVQDGRHGYRIDPGDPDDLSARMRELAPRAAAMAADCIALAARFPREATARRISQLLSGLKAPGGTCPAAPPHPDDLAGTRPGSAG